MRGIVLLVALSATLTHAAANDYVEVRDFNLDAGSISELEIDAGAGSLDVVGDTGVDAIVVKATITVPGKDEERALEIIERDMTLTLEQTGDRAVLQSYFESGMFSWGDSPSIELEVQVPERLSLLVDDGSGSIDVRGVHGSIGLDDGSGSISLVDVGAVEIDDGSGSIKIEEVGGDVRIVDGSGSIVIRQVNGSVRVDDGSGSINVSDVSNDLIVEDDGSGGVSFARIGGRVEQND